MQIHILRKMFCLRFLKMIRVLNFLRGKVENFSVEETNDILYYFTAAVNKFQTQILFTYGTLVNKHYNRLF